MKTKIIGILLILFAGVLWIYYTYNLLVVGNIIPNMLAIPDIFLLDAFWIIALPVFLLVSAGIALMVWLGYSTFSTPEPRVTDEELQKLEELERIARAKRMQEKSEKKSA